MAKGGLRCRDLSGNITFDTSYKISRFLGEFATGEQNGQMSDDRLWTGKGFVVFVGYDTYHKDSYPHVWIDGNTIYWRFMHGDWWPKNSVRFMYGVTTR